VSIIIPCYNAERWVGEAIDSCLAQTYRPLEIIVVDDGSTDGSLEIIKEYADSHRDIVQYETGPNRGGCAARNRGIDLSNGDYLMFLDADDYISEDTITALVKLIVAQHKHVVGACRWHYLFETDHGWDAVQSEAPTVAETEDYLRLWIKGGFIPPVALLWPRKLIDSINGWDETLTANQDGDLMYRALLQGAKVFHTHEGSAYYRKHKSHMSVSSSRSKAAYQSRFRVIEKVEHTLREQGRLGDYAIELGQAYYSLAVGGFERDIDLARKALARSKDLAGNQAVTGTLVHRILSRIIGLEQKEKLARNLAKLGIGRKLRKRLHTRMQLS